ncbi:MAG TPA: DUF2786 domain-containing protein [Candidatus Thiothrix moscowensis]|uniref:DUF2786 domain-containing protein n=1 Tax=unclassified Thiothrix TaxID=2636184 RepID=UPI0025FEBFF0|nr:MULTISPECIES: DUF2786 domain-containing protein [unclassified Thiothrix]HRJ52212.1 DUF2786 domain-containing protein [Candidatus Thiothrix moscowensis]HRJ92527.1 DUF2786 domain-containing protein [Candidatus Thiothrix moscowensis]
MTTENLAADSDRILGKIKKCLALASSNVPGEAAAAMRQAKKLMDKYGITEAQVKLSEVIAVRTGKAPPAKDRASNLVITVAQAFACKPLIVRNDEGDPVFEFIGKGHYPELAAYTFDVLWRRLEVERCAFHEQMLVNLLDPEWDLGRDALAARMGRDGCDGEVQYRLRRAKSLKQQAKEDARKATTAFCVGWLRVVGETVRSFAGHEPDQDIEDWALQKYSKLKTRTTRQHRDLDADGVRAGLDSGSRVSLHHGVQGRSGAGQRLLE